MVFKAIEKIIAAHSHLAPKGTTDCGLEYRMKRLHLLQLVGWSCLLLLSACSSIAPPEEAVPDIEIIEADRSETEAVRITMPSRQLEGASNSAVDQLLAEASAAIAAQHYERANALIERAVRVAPHDARAYFGLSQVNYHQKRLALSQSFLQKARSLAVNDKQLLMSIDKFAERLGADY